ncbi:MAG: heavy metal-responsive transcriptional regulator [Planctomycetota bacterium]
METLTITQLARKIKVPTQTIRYYERIGILPHPPRRSSGYREYAPSDAKRIQFIKKAQNLGFTLQEIQELLRFRLDPETNCQDVDKRVQEKIECIDHKIQDLQRMKKALLKLIRTCENSPLKTCLILDFLEKDHDQFFS